MTRDWMSFQLLHPTWLNTDEHSARAITDVVPALVRHLRSADAGGRWHFRRGGAAGHVEVWFHTTSTVIDELEHRLRQQSRQHDWPVLVAPRAAELPDGAGSSALSAPLSALSSDFALDLLADGALPAEDQVVAAAINLRFLTEQLPVAARAPFLFHGWQHWSAGLTPAQRVELGEQAHKEAEDLLRATEEAVDRAHWRQPWQRYFAGLAAAVAAHGTPEHTTYALFEHAQATHNRLGIGAAAESVAARALRTALSRHAGAVPSLRQPVPAAA